MAVIENVTERNALIKELFKEFHEFQNIIDFLEQKKSIVSEKIDEIYRDNNLIRAKK